MSNRVQNKIAFPPHVVSVLANAGYKVSDGRAYYDGRPCTAHETRVCEALLAAAFVDHGDMIYSRTVVQGGLVH